MRTKLGAPFMYIRSRPQDTPSFVGGGSIVLHASSGGDIRSVDKQQNHLQNDDCQFCMTCGLKLLL